MPKHVDEIVTENFLNLEKDTTIHVQENQRSPVRFNTTKSTYNLF